MDLTEKHAGLNTLEKPPWFFQNFNLAKQAGLNTLEKPTGFFKTLILSNKQD